MMKLKRTLCIILTLITSILALSGCKDGSITYQNQFLNIFGIDFVSTKYQKVETDELKDYIYIELNEFEKAKMEERVSSSNLFYDISEKNSDYVSLKEILENRFSQNIKNIEDGYFSIYNKSSQQIINLSAVNFQKINMDFFTALIYDSKTGIIYLFNYNLS